MGRKKRVVSLPMQMSLCRKGSNIVLWRVSHSSHTPFKGESYSRRGCRICHSTTFLSKSRFPRVTSVPYSISKIVAIPPFRHSKRNTPPICFCGNFATFFLFKQKSRDLLTPEKSLNGPIEVRGMLSTIRLLYDIKLSHRLTSSFLYNLMLFVL